VVNGVYTIVAEAVDSQSGDRATLSEFITVAASRTEIVARIFNAAGEEVAVLTSDNVSVPVAEIRVEPNPYEPTVAAGQPALIQLFDRDGNRINLSSTPSENGLLWYGRTCPDAPNHVCTSPTDGRLVNNGVYMVVVTSNDPEQGRATASAALTVAHGQFELISDVRAVPNPIAQEALEETAGAQLWITYVIPGGSPLTGLRVKVYNLASELVRTYDATDQGLPANPLGARVGAAVNCPAGSTCGFFGWDGRNQQGVVCAAGLYVVVIEATDAAGNLQRELVKVAIQ
jgi:hypothetical protein